MDATLAEVRRIVYDTFAYEGRAPSVREVAKRMAVTYGEALDQLGQLAAMHQLVLNADGAAIRMAHPFSAVPMGFVVTADNDVDERAWWGGCMWDSIGIAAALDTNVRIDTACPGCGAQHTVRCGPHDYPTNPLVVHFLVPARAWWRDVVHTCSHIRAFCEPSHAQAWASKAGVERGPLVSLPDVWFLAGRWYADRLDPDYQPRPVAESQAILAEADLTDEFWRLPA